MCCVLVITYLLHDISIYIELTSNVNSTSIMNTCNQLRKLISSKNSVQIKVIFLFPKSHKHQNTVLVSLERYFLGFRKKVSVRTSFTPKIEFERADIKSNPKSWHRAVLYHMYHTIPCSTPPVTLRKTASFWNGRVANSSLLKRSAIMLPSVIHMNRIDPAVNVVIGPCFR